MLSSSGPIKPSLIVKSANNDAVTLNWGDLSSTSALNGNGKVTEWTLKRGFSKEVLETLKVIANDSEKPTLTYTDPTTTTKDGDLYYTLAAKGDTGGYGPFSDAVKALSVATGSAAIPTNFI